MIQKRADAKYHSKGLWSNTTCGHPEQGEKTTDAALRRLKEEMGFECGIKEIFSLTYKSDMDNGLIENEIDHVFIGCFNGPPEYNPIEVSGWKWISVEELLHDMKINPEIYTCWFKITAERISVYTEKTPLL